MTEPRAPIRMRPGSRLMRGMTGILCSWFLLIALPPTVRAAQYPRPHDWVNDFAGVLTSEAAQRLESVLGELKQSSTFEVAVVTLPTVPDGDVDRAGTEIFQEWGIGKRRQDTGVLILCAVHDRKVRIEVGYGLEGVLPDAKAGRIIRDIMVPQFRAGQLSRGLEDGTMAVAGILATHAGVQLAHRPAATRSVPREDMWITYFGLFMLFILPLVLRGILPLAFPMYGWGNYGSWGGSGGGFGGGSFGGFGGGGSGGGGASGSW